MFATEVGSRTCPKLAITIVIASLFIAAAAFTIAHNIPVHNWFSL